jgi:murein DD-endopeptidase MepM/ murein hydrolase activator NlpD
MSAAGGVVKGTGNTDLTCKGASWGQWVLIQHDNGLTTLYGHLSVIKVVKGQRVDVGDTIAYSGNTGASTGPHLHFTVYATDGVKIGNLPSSACKGKVYTEPLLTEKGAYLNPLNYLPSK